MNQLICFMLQSCASPCSCVLQQHPPPSWKTPEITFRLCFQQFLYACCYFLTFAVCEEVFAESVSCNSAFNQLPVQIFQDSAQVVMCNLLYFIQDLLIALFRNNSFLGIALSALTFKQFFENILKIQFRAPAEALAKGSAMALPSLIWANI